MVRAGHWRNRTVNDYFDAALAEKRDQLALSSIGQYDVAASPLQMAMVSAAIANDGVLMDPYVVSRLLMETCCGALAEPELEVVAG